jgi:perosamine synthetase
VVGVKPGDLVLVPTLTFIAPANAVRYLGAEPVFIDAEAEHWQLDPELCSQFLHEDCERRGSQLVHRATGRRVAAILPVHVLGHPANLDAICSLAREFELAVVEDATESLGSEWRDRPTGTFGQMGCFSFNGNKIITTGGGGMLVTSDATLAEHARYLSTQAKNDALEYVHHEIGYNYRLTNLQAALGCAQLERLRHFVARKRAIAARYHSAFGGVDGILLQREAREARSNWWLFTVRIVAEEFGQTARALLGQLEAARIQTRPLWQPLHQSPAHVGSLSVGGEVAEMLNRECLSLPSSVGLSIEHQERVIELILQQLKVSTH